MLNIAKSFLDVALPPEMFTEPETSVAQVIDITGAASADFGELMQIVSAIVIGILFIAAIVSVGVFAAKTAKEHKAAEGGL